MYLKKYRKSSTYQGVFVKVGLTGGNFYDILKVRKFERKFENSQKPRWKRSLIRKTHTGFSLVLWSLKQDWENTRRYSKTFPLSLYILVKSFHLKILSFKVVCESIIFGLTGLVLMLEKIGFVQSNYFTDFDIFSLWKVFNNTFVLPRPLNNKPS